MFINMFINDRKRNYSIKITNQWKETDTSTSFTVKQQLSFPLSLP